MSDKPITMTPEQIEIAKLPHSAWKSATPRTGAVVYYDKFSGRPKELNLVDLCRDLERELAAERQARRAAEKALAEATTWTKDDLPLPEDDAISAAHPVETDRHDLYQEAMRMVGAKRSKGALVDLVNWLLYTREIEEHVRGLAMQQSKEDHLRYEHAYQCALEAEKDALRYRWIKDHEWDGYFDDVIACHGEPSFEHKIDAAIAAQTRYKT